MKQLAVSVGQSAFAAAREVISDGAVNLNTVPGMFGNMAAEAGAAEVTEIDFSIGSISLGGNCINLTREDGTVDSFWFDSDESDADPEEGDNQYEINILGAEGPSEWAAAAAAVIDSHANWVATGVSGVLTITATGTYPGPVVADGDPHATSLDLNITTAGADGSLTVNTISLRDGQVKIIQFEANIILNNFGSGGSDITTTAGQYGIFVGQADNTGELAGGALLGGGGDTTGLLDFKGAQDCSGNPNYPAASKGDFYLVSVAGKIGGASGTVVQAGDAYYAIADNAGGTQAGVGASWAVVQGNVVAATDAVPGYVELATTAEAAAGTDTARAVTPAGLVEFSKQVTKTTAAGYTIGTTDPREMYGGIVTVTSAATLVLPAVANGMSVLVSTEGAIAVSVDPNAADKIYLDGVALDDGDKITNLSTAGDTAFIWSRNDGTGWNASTNAWTDGGA